MFNNILILLEAVETHKKWSFILSFYMSSVEILETNVLKSWSHQFCQLMSHGVMIKYSKDFS